MTNPARERWNQRYQGDDYLFGTAPNGFLADQGQLLRPGQRALSIADGEGRNGVWLAEQGLDVLSIDFSPVAQAKAQRLAAARGVRIETRQADIAAWDWAAEDFDVIAAIFFQFAAPPLRAEIFAGLQQALRPGGVLLMQGYRPEQLEYGTGGPPEAERMYTAAMLREAFAALEIRHLREHDSVVHEGDGHEGMSALVDLVAVKPDS
ncbi:MAG: class I SAM-dependent methyltransferase [Alphaproteobacteria bacterium]|jgi:cyclopropane fatty-acyl-phospholipid synthase-like methyltransferase|nr:class I SAM-dependent methyltransferase [Alphaproteobacteria bacterium]MDP6563421.1 class I SAM-dependent methyltransferase [Alphaproteobacteria bacterium]MDP6812872.1 class I SAM-dependent methyltransferase [Alphaproteobacteria bacterium]